MKKDKQPILLITIGTVLAALSTMLVIAQQEVAVPAGETAPVPPAVTDGATAPAEVVPPAPQPEKPVTAVDQPKPAETTTAPAATNQPDGSIFLEVPKDNGTALPANAGTPIEATGDGKISISLDDVALIDAVKMFTRISGANIMYPGNITNAKVNVNLNNVDWKPALESILDMQTPPYGLIEKSPGSQVYTIVVKSGVEPMIVKTFSLKYATVSNLFPTVVAMVPPPGKVSSFPSRNVLVVQTTSANQSEIKQLIESVDTMREQVFIEAKFMELNDSAQKDLGINWQSLQGYNISAGNLNYNYAENRNWDQSDVTTLNRWDKRNNVDGINRNYDMYGAQFEKTDVTYEEFPPGSGNFVTTTEITPTRTVADTVDTGQNITRDITDGFTKSVADVKTAVLGAADFNVILSALKQMNGVSVVSNPKLLVANEEPATIHIGEIERPFISQVTPGSLNAAPTILYNPGDPVNTGVKLTVTPTVNTESNITVKIEPELTRFVRDAIAPNGQTYPVISTKKITTVFCLESGKTVAIGGLTGANDREVSTKIPILGDIPIIGKYLFSHKSDKKAQDETIIFVTVGLAKPSEIRNDSGLPEDTELTKRKLIEKDLRRSKFNAEVEEERQKADEAISKRADKVRSKLKNNN